MDNELMINEFYAKAKNYIADKLGIPNTDVKVLHETTASFPETNVSLWAGKVASGDNIYAIYINKSTQTISENIEDYREAEKQTIKAKYGKLTKSLYEKIQNLGDNDEIDISIWLKIPNDAEININMIKQKYPSVEFLGKRPNISDYNTLKNIEKDIIAEKEKLYLSIVDPVANKVTNTGIKIESTSKLSPSLFASVTKKQLKDLEAIPEIETIYLSEVTKPQSSTAVSTTRVYELWNRGFNGGSNIIQRVVSNLNLTVEILASGLNVREGPSTGFAISGTVSSGEFYSVVRWDPRDWVEIKLDRDTTGWISMNSNTFAIGRFPGTGEIAVVTGTTVNIRQGPGTTFAVLEQVYQNAELIVLEVGASWTRIKSMQGTVGWISNSLITRQTTGNSPTGRQIRVAVVEAFGIDISNTWISQGLGGSFRPATPYDLTELSPHPTAVAGCIVAIERGARGLAPGVTLLNANAATFGNANLIAAAEWAIGTANADILNCSFGADTNGAMGYLARYFDHVANDHSKLVVVSAGNMYEDPPGTEHWSVMSPALGYNVLAVGAMFDDTTGSWGDDEISEWFTCFENPVSDHSDRKKPELSAPGELIYLTVPTTHRIDTDGDDVRDTTVTQSDGATNFDGQIVDYNGTSMAAPFVSAIAADLMELSGDMIGNPELARAVLIAGATHEVSTAAQTGVWDDKEGVGTVNAFGSYNVLINGRYAFGNWGQANYPRTYSVSLLSGQKIRAVVAWNSQTTTDASHSDPGTTSVQQIDLDLLLYDASNNILTTSSSFDNTVEVVEYTAPTNMTVTIRINAFRYDATGSQPAAVAWNIY